MVLVRVKLCVTSSRFQKVAEVIAIGFTFAPHWFVKTSRLLHEFHSFIVG